MPSHTVLSMLDHHVAASESHGTQVIGQITDVSDGDSVDELGARCLEAFGSVHVVCNNAGVAGTGRGGRLYAAEWKWVLDVNLWGVIHGHRVFLPQLVAQGEGHIINTASMAGHLPGHSAYTASKWAVVGITQGLFHQMQAEQTGVGVSCLCPGFVSTEIHNSDRNQPEEAAPNALAEPTADDEMRWAFMSEMVTSGRPPAEVADMVHDAVLGDRFWIFTDLEMVNVLAEKHDSIMENRNPRAPAFPPR